jgi:hypothetical protein
MTSTGREVVSEEGMQTHRASDMRRLPLDRTSTPVNDAELVTLATPALESVRVLASAGNAALARLIERTSTGTSHRSLLRGLVGGAPAASIVARALNDADTVPKTPMAPAASQVRGRKAISQKTRRPRYDFDELAKWPGNARRAWKKLGKKSRKIVTDRMSARYGNEFADRFVALLKAPEPVGAIWGPGLGPSPETLLMHGYKRASLSWMNEFWVHPSGAVVALMHETPKEGERAPAGARAPGAATSPLEEEEADDPVAEAEIFVDEWWDALRADREQILALINEITRRGGSQQNPELRQELERRLAEFWEKQSTVSESLAELAED